MHAAKRVAVILNIGIRTPALIIIIIIILTTIIEITIIATTDNG